MDTKVVPRLRAGIGQGYFAEAAVPKLAVRIRSGIEVSKGSFFGDDRRATAFVWVDEPVATPDRILLVRVGKAGRWLWDRTGAPVELTELFPGDRQVARLDERLAEWQGYFERQYKPKTPNLFRWGRFHKEGLRLARQLQALLIDRAVVHYLRPSEDPEFPFDQELPL